MLIYVDFETQRATNKSITVLDRNLLRQLSIKSPKNVYTHVGYEGSSDNQQCVDECNFTSRILRHIIELLCVHVENRHLHRQIYRSHVSPETDVLSPSNRVRDI